MRNRLGGLLRELDQEWSGNKFRCYLVLRAAPDGFAASLTVVLRCF